MLDIYAIEELRTKGVAATDDSLKYRYSSDERGQYGGCLSPSSSPPSCAILTVRVCVRMYVRRVPAGLRHCAGPASGPHLLHGGELGAGVRRAAGPDVLLRRAGGADVRRGVHGPRGRQHRRRKCERGAALAWRRFSVASTALMFLLFLPEDGVHGEEHPGPGGVCPPRGDGLRDAEAGRPSDPTCGRGEDTSSAWSA